MKVRTIDKADGIPAGNDKMFGGVLIHQETDVGHKTGFQAVIIGAFRLAVFVQQETEQLILELAQLQDIGAGQPVHP